VTFDSIYLERRVAALKNNAVVHLGNYFGCLRQSLIAQSLYPRDNFIFIADHHYLSEQDYFNGNEHRRTRELVRDFIALGFNPDKTSIYRQSDIGELFSFMWLISCLTPERRLWDARDTADLDITVAKLLYLQLMAADILGIRATSVSVGPDEETHVNYVQEVATRVNERAERVIIPVPNRPSLPFKGPVPGINGDPMSTSFNNTIGVFDKEDVISRRFRAVEVKEESRHKPIDPDSDICFKIFSLCSSEHEANDLRRQYEDNRIGKREARRIAKDKFLEFFAVERDQRQIMINTPDSEIDDVLFEGQKRARREVRETKALLESVLQGVARNN
jgi:tryptophanyl-tRNA synthetase